MTVPLLLAMTIGLFWMLTLAADQVRVQDAASQIARAVARGDDQGQAVDRGLGIAPHGARASVTSSGGYVRVEVSVRTRAGPGLLAHVGTLTLKAEATALLEEQSASGGSRAASP